jgi:hypothetical protein
LGREKYRKKVLAKKLEEQKRANEASQYDDKAGDAGNIFVFGIYNGRVRHGQ